MRRLWCLYGSLPAVSSELLLTLATGYRHAKELFEETLLALFLNHTAVVANEHRLVLHLLIRHLSSFGEVLDLVMLCHLVVVDLFFYKDLSVCVLRYCQ